MPRWGSKLWHTESGNIALITALALLPLSVVAGGAVDIWHAASVRTELQAAVDGGVLAGARRLVDNGADAEGAATVAKHHSSALFPHPTFGLALTPLVDGAAGTVTLTGIARVPNTFLNLIGISESEVGASAKARVRPRDGTPVCLHALSGSAEPGYLASGSSSANAPGCTTWINSTSARAVTLSGGSRLTAARNCFAGGVKQGLNRITPAPEKCDARPDPFSAMTVPTGPCTFNDFRGTKAVTLVPGVYCGGIKLTGGAQVEVRPGVYVVRDGDLIMSGGGTMRGDGVTFIIEGQSTVNLSGGGSYWLRAPTSGPTASFLFFQKRDASPGARAKMSGGGDLYYEGIIYFPTQNVEVSGGGSTTTISPFTAYIANTFLYSGGSALNINVDRARTTVPIPALLYTERGGVTLVE